jgi:hypothetical protein
MSIQPLDESRRRELIINFVSTHQGCTAEDIVKGQNKIGRKKVFKILNELKKEAIILSEQSETNRRNIKLFVNGNNLLVSVPRQLEEFNKVFFDLLMKAEEKVSDKTNYEQDLIYDLILIYQHVVGIYLLNSLLIWPKILKDKNSLNNLYTMFFGKIVEIQSKLSEIFKVTDFLPPFNQATVAAVDSPLSNSLITDSFHLSPANMLRIVDVCKRYQILNEVKPVLDVAWKIGFDIYPYTELDLNLIPEDRDTVLKDWRIAIGYYMYKNNLKGLEETMNELHE